MPEVHSQAALLELEEQRKGVARARLNSFCCIAAGLITALAGIIVGASGIALIIIGVVILLGGAFLYYGANERITRYSSDFKQKVIRALLLDVDPSLRIEPENGMSVEEFVNMGIFDQHPDRMTSEDQITGRSGKTAFCFSEVHAQYKTTTTTKRGTQEHWHDIFEGIIFVADFNKHFEGVTVVRAKDTGNAISAWIAKNIPLLSSDSKHLVQLENIDFCKEFVTYSNDQVEARYILTPSMMERLCELNSRSAYTISVSFIDRYMHLAFPQYKNYFEPPVFKTLLDPNLLKDDIEIIKFMYGIVQDLDLNTRIWGKK